ncbi:hypothetical protein NOC27_152 [Nitrosococcus oceani AFC27]|nr:hypothetical protein NOC27_152 [Nitrosococcus oceani AFC27]
MLMSISLLSMSAAATPLAGVLRVNPDDRHTEGVLLYSG